MKQKYQILKETDQKKLVIKEFAELDKEILSLLCEEEYDIKMIKAAISKGKEALISELRTNNMYPPSVYAEKIAQAVIDIFGSKGNQSVELAFNDVDLIIKEQELSQELDETDNIIDDIDQLIDDDPKEKTPKKKKKDTSKIDKS
ncbi:MAG: hypothetical protein KJN80_03945 [Deltaproteobacteria bacterium]|nr:hypothetical protein [Deltaproteobacteria bacterium]